MINNLSITIFKTGEIFFGNTNKNLEANGKGIYFSRRYSHTNIGGSTDQQDIYYSEIYEGKWTNAYNLGKPLNNHGPNAVCAVTPDGNRVLLMNTYDVNGNPERPWKR